MANAGPDQPLEWVQGLEVTLDGTGSSDPDDDPLTFAWTDSEGSPLGSTATLTLSLGLGVHSFTLVVNDGQVDSPPDTVQITIVDTTPPEVTAALVPVPPKAGSGKSSGKSDKSGKGNGLHTVEFSCEDACDLEPDITTATLNGVPVTNGQVVSLKFGKAPKSGSDKSDKSGKQRILTLKAPSFLLEVECVDEAGNPGSGEFELSPPPKQASDKSDKSGKSGKSDKSDKSGKSGKSSKK